MKSLKINILILFVILTGSLSGAQSVTINGTALDERNLDGAIINVSLSSDKFITSALTPGDFTLHNAPTGTTISAVSYKNNVTATLTLSYNLTDFDASINNFYIDVSAGILESNLTLTSNNLTIAAYDETLQATNTGSLSETNLNGATFDLTLNQDEFADNTLSAANFTLNSAPAGTSIAAVNWKSPTTATVIIAYDNTDFDADSTGVTVSISGNELLSTHPLTSNAFTITAVVEPATATIVADQNMSESNLDARSLTLTLSQTQFTSPATLVPSNFTLNGAPVGTTIESVTNPTSASVVINLAFNGTDFDVDKNMSVTVNGSVLAVGSPVVSNSLTITAIVEPATATIVADQAMTETNLDARSLTLTLSQTDFINPSTLSTADFTLNNAPTGTTIESIANATSTSVVINLAFDGTDFDTDKNLSVNINGTVISSGALLTSNSLIITAVVETPAAVITADQSMTEANLDARSLTLTLSQTDFASPSTLTSADFTLNNAPAGTSIESLASPTSTSVVINLAFNGTDFDVDKNMSVSISGSVLTSNTLLTSNALTITAVVEPATASIVADQDMTETNLDARSLTLSLSQTQFTSPSTLTPANFTLNNVPSGTTIESLANQTATSVVINLAFNGTDFDVDKNMSVTVSGSVLAVGSPVVSNTLTITAIVEPANATIVADQNMTETNLDARSLTLTLSQTSFSNPASLTSASFTLNNAPAGTSIESLTNRTSSSVVINLAFDGTDFDTDKNMSVTISGAVLATGSPITSNSLTVTAIVEPAGATIIPDQSMTESNLNGRSLTLKVYNNFFTNPSGLAISDFKLNNAPAGTSIESISNRTSTSVIITLAFDGTDFDVDKNISITISHNVLLIGLTDLTTNEVLITAQIEPEIQGVSIPNQPMKINDVVTATISVKDDGGALYSLTSGTIGNYPLYNFTRINNTNYTAKFTITSGGNSYIASADIPVNNLKISNGSIQSNTWTGAISQNNDPIDAQPPIINEMLVTTGNRKVGDNVLLILVADNTGYTVDPSTTVNSIAVTSSNVVFSEVGSGTYSISYTVAEGDNDVQAGNLEASIVLVDDAGNKNAPFTTIKSNTVAIDANSPKISSMVIEPGNKSVGDTVNVTINADGNNYTINNATTINNIPVSSPRVVFKSLGNNQYLLSYLVASGDNSVPAGALSMNVVLNDAAGNTSLAYTTPEPNTVAIFASLPTASITGTASICQGTGTQLIITLTGVSPWKVIYSDGTNTYSIDNIASGYYALTVSPSSSKTYTIISVTDGNGNTNIGSGSATVNVKPLPDVSITGLNPAYSVDSNPVPLNGTPEGGTFSGPGVFSSTAMFYPNVAGTEGSPHSIVYTYTDGSTSCTNRDTAMVSVIEAQGVIQFPDNDYFFCNYDPRVTITGANLVNDTGSFAISGGKGLTDLGDNSAIIDPSVLTTGTYTVSYTYFDGDNLTIYQNFEVEHLNDATISSLNDLSYCTNESPIALTGNLASGIFSGPGVSGDLSNGFEFDPSKAVPGNDTILYAYTSSHGCSTSTYKVVKVHPAPQVHFSIDDACISGLTSDSVHFNNQTVSLDSVTSWSWTFGDIGSGLSNYSTRENPSHRYTVPGQKNVVLTANTIQFCSAHLDTIIDLGDKPVASFSWETECYHPGQAIKFTNLSTSVNPIVSNQWTFHKNPGLDVFYTTDVNYTFESQNSFAVDLITETNKGCKDTVSRTIYLRPTITLQDSSYREQFEMGENGWLSEAKAGTQVNSWQFGEPNGQIINHAASGTKAWYTDIANRNQTEQSWVTSPCFDFSGTSRPMISMDIWRSFDYNNDGTVLQYSTDDGKTWSNVGAINDGINWYNSFEINNGPGEQNVGWTGTETFNPDDNWINARHKLDNLKGQKSVRFRIAYGSDGNSNELNEGFAFDNIYIGKRTKKVLLEHFTNVSVAASQEANAVVNSILSSLPSDVVNIQYHTGQGSDPFYNDNPIDPGVRVLYYGIPSVPYALLDGGIEEKAYDFNTLKPSAVDVNLRSLADPVFDIGLSTTLDQNTFSIKAKVTADKALSGHEITIHTVVLEKSVTDYDGVKYKNVMKKMLPDAAGSTFLRNWQKGDSEELNLSWNLKNVYDPEKLIAVVFVQDEGTHEVYQAASSDTATGPTGIFPTLNNGNTGSFILYPNPARETVYVEFDEPIANSGELSLFTLSGSLVRKIRFEERQKRIEINLSDIPDGTYLIGIRNRYTNHFKRIVVTH